jgi:transcriptional antiterminator RfaH
MKGAMHKLWKKPSSQTHSVASSYKNRPVKELVGPPRPAALAERVDGRWTVMHTGPKQEMAAVAQLRRDGYAAYCPVVTRWVRIGRSKTIRHVPLFPRYVFVGLKPGASKSLNACLWGRPLALDNGNIPFVSGGLVYALSDMQEAGAWDEAKAQAISEAERTRIAKKASEHFRKGDIVTVTDDVWEGFTATVLRAGDDERVILLMNLLGAETKVQVRLDQIKAAA